MGRLLSLAVLATLFLGACASVRETFTPDGRKAYALNCSGAARGWDKCFSSAGEICQAKGYDILDRTGESTGAVGGGSSGFFGVHTSERSMVIACKG